MDSDEVFGSDEQRRLLVRSATLMRLLSDDPRFASHGRGVQIDDYTPQALDLADAIVRMTGGAIILSVPRAETDAVQQSLAGLGYDADVFGLCCGGAASIGLAREMLAARPLPAKTEVRIIDAEAPADLLEAFAEVALAQGVLPSHGAALRGITHPGFGMVAFDGAGRPVATAAAIMPHHRDHANARTAYWGQLATTDSRKGEGIALALGARAILHAAEHLGAGAFYTGIRAGNAPSTGLCAHLGVCDTGLDAIIVTDPAAFSGGRVTK